MPIKCVLFDLDGTLFDTQKLHATIESRLLAEHGINLSAQEITAAYAGMRTQDFFANLIGDAELAKNAADKKWLQIMSLAKQTQPLGDLQKLFSILKNIKMAIGTASLQAWAVSILEHHNLKHYFDNENIIGGNMVAHTKPAPEVWLKAGAGFNPEDCAVVEDGLAGTLGGLTYGMNVFLIKPQTNPQTIAINSVNDLLNFI